MYRQIEDIEEIERLDERNGELSRENAKLRKKNESRKLKKEKLTRQNEELTRQNEELTRQVTELRAAALPKKMKVCARCGEGEREGVEYHAMTHPNSTFDLCQKCFHTPTMELTIEELCEQEREREREREREKIEIEQSISVIMNVDDYE
jgi:DNA repair exonuclease SbcCD ATPase subunit